nr:hypothetical protein [Tanacetum cinerariifolium]
MLYSAAYRSLGVLQSGTRARVVAIIGEPLSPDRVFDFPEDEPKPHPTYDFVAPGPLPGYIGYPNNNNEWLKVDDYLLGELKAMVNESMVVPAIKEGVEPEEVWALNEEWLMDLVTSPPVPAVQPPSVYEVGGPSTVAAEGPSFPFPAAGLHVPPAVIEDLSTRLGNLEYRHGQLVKKVIQVSDAEVASDVSIGEIGPRVFAIKGQVQTAWRESHASHYDRVVLKRKYLRYCSERVCLERSEV